MTIANKVKALGARVTMSAEDIRSRLHADHVKFREWTTKMTEGKRASERARAFANLKPELTAHARAEERIAYNGLIRSAGDREADETGLEGYVEHHIADHLVARLSALNPASDEWRAHAKVLHEMLSHHIQEEETDVFAQLGDAFSREELEEMGARFEQAKRGIGRRGGNRKQKATQKAATVRKSRTNKASAAKRAPVRSNNRVAKRGRHSTARKSASR